MAKKHSNRKTATGKTLPHCLLCGEPLKATSKARFCGPDCRGAGRRITSFCRLRGEVSRD